MNVSELITRATSYGSEIKTSTLVLARLLKITPKDLAEAIYSEELNDSYRAELAGQLVKALVKKEAEDKKVNLAEEMVKVLKTNK